MTHQHELSWICKTYQLNVWFANICWWELSWYILSIHCNSHQLTLTLHFSNVFNGSIHRLLLSHSTNQLWALAITFGDNSRGKLRQPSSCDQLRALTTTSNNKLQWPTLTTTCVRPTLGSDYKLRRKSPLKINFDDHLRMKNSNDQL